MKILISGASGLVGKTLIPKLEADGHKILTLVRKAPKSESEVEWNPEKEIKNISKLEGVECVIHLAGENVGDGRWTEEKKKRIVDSRVVGTKVLCDALLKLHKLPKTFISASAIGIYGNRGDEILTEESAFGHDFLAQVCIEWEKASNVLKETNIRLVYARLGVVLSKRGGALAKMLTPFKFCIGGKMGSGNQYMSWIAMDDAIEIIKLLISNEEISGAVNITAPNPVTNAEFTETLGKVLSRPTFFTIPKFALNFVFGEMADMTVLTSQKVISKKLQELQYQFLYPTLELALKYLLKK